MTDPTTSDPVARVVAAMTAYTHAFGVPAPQPMMVGDDELAAVLEAAVKRGRPLRKNYNWWAGLPPDAVA